MKRRPPQANEGLCRAIYGVRPDQLYGEPNPMRLPNQGAEPLSMMDTAVIMNGIEVKPGLAARKGARSRFAP